MIVKLCFMPLSSCDLISLYSTHPHQGINMSPMGIRLPTEALETSAPLKQNAIQRKIEAPSDNPKCLDHLYNPVQATV